MKTPAEWPGVLKTPGATDWPGSLNPFEGEFALYDMLKVCSPFVQLVELTSVPIISRLHRVAQVLRSRPRGSRLGRRVAKQ